MRALKVLVACEFSGTVREAWLAAGHDAWSCDLLPDLMGSNRHLQCDVYEVLDRGWDLVIAHPPCTRLCNSGVRWLIQAPTKLEAGHYSTEQTAYFEWCNAEERLEFMWDQLIAGAQFFSDLLNADIPNVAAENPIMHGHAKTFIQGFTKQDQIVQPWHHGDPAFKSTALWLRGKIEPLVDTDRLTPPLKGTPEHKAWSFVHMASPSVDRWVARSTFFPGIANAMAAQWGAQIQATL